MRREHKPRQRFVGVEQSFRRQENWAKVIAVHTDQRAAERARAHLMHQVWVSYQAQRSHARRCDRIARPLFAGCMIVWPDLERDRWRAVNST